jgi:hypothetical protein
MSNKRKEIFLGSRALPANKADLTAIFDVIVGFSINLNTIGLHGNNFLLMVKQTTMSELFLSYMKQIKV